MKHFMQLKHILIALSLVGASEAAYSQIDITNIINVPGNTKPILVSMSGLTGEAATTLQFDLYVQGFAFTNAEAAQYLISGSNNGNLQARATDPHNKSTLVSKAYSGASLRRQVHAFADDFVQALGRKGIAQTKIAFKGENSPTSEIYIADFDGHNAQAVTKDNNLVAAPCWVPGHMALYYVSYKLNHADIFYHDLSTGARRAFARYGGSNMSPAASPGGSKVAMILSKDGWTDLYVCDADGSDLKRLTKSPQDESSPCWSPDGKWICFAAKERERRTLCKVSPSGGAMQTDRDQRHAQSDGAGLVAGRQVDCVHGAIPVRASRSASCRPRAAPRYRWSKAKTRPGRRIPGRWPSVGGAAGITCSLCLTCRRNNTKMFPGFRELARSHNPVGPNKPVHEREKYETEQVCQPVGDRISPDASQPPAAGRSLST